MSEQYTISLAKIIKELSLEVVNLPGEAEDILVSSRDVNRPGVELGGYTEAFDNTRINVIGRGEANMLDSLGAEERSKRLETFFSLKPVAVIVARGMQIDEQMVIHARTHGVPLFHSADSTSNIIAGLVSYLNVELAPRITRHGVLVEVYGEGILLVGDSGVGKSETAVEIVKRGHRLVADDAVEIRRVSNKTLVGQAPDNIRHFIELRGIGIINARRIFGMGAVKLSEKIDLVINLEIWDPTKVYDRMGIDNEYTEILGVRVPVMTVPVKPGRNVAIIIEVAAMNNRQKKMGYNAAHELLANLGMDVSMMPAEEIKRDLDI